MKRSETVLNRLLKIGVFHLCIDKTSTGPLDSVARGVCADPADDVLRKVQPEHQYNHAQRNHQARTHSHSCQWAQTPL